MAITQVGSATYHSHANLINVPVPSGTQEGDLLLVSVVSANATITFLQEGWTSTGPESPGAGIGTGTMRHRALWRIATASEPATYDFTQGISAPVFQGTMTTWRGVDINNPIFDSTADADSIDVTEPRPCPDISVAPGVLVLSYRQCRSAGSSSAQHYTAPAGNTLIHSGVGTSGTTHFGYGFFKKDTVETSAGTIPGIDITISFDVDIGETNNIGRSFALRPAPEQKSAATVIDLAVAVGGAATDKTAASNAALGVTADMDAAATKAAPVSSVVDIGLDFAGDVEKSRSATSVLGVDLGSRGSPTFKATSSAAEVDLSVGINAAPRQDTSGTITAHLTGMGLQQPWFSAISAGVKDGQVVVAADTQPLSFTADVKDAHTLSLGANSTTTTAGNEPLELTLGI